MRLMPSLVIDVDEVDLLLAAVDAAIADLVAGRGPVESAATSPASSPAPASQRGHGGAGELSDGRLG